jgi:hypothetical protein
MRPFTWCVLDPSLGVPKGQSKQNFRWLLHAVPWWQFQEKAASLNRRRLFLEDNEKKKDPPACRDSEGIRRLWPFFRHKPVTAPVLAMNEPGREPFPWPELT